MRASSVRTNAGVRRAPADKSGKKSGHSEARTKRQSSPLMSPAIKAGWVGGGMDGVAGELASMPPIQRQSAVLSLQRTRGNSFVQSLASFITPPLQRQTEEEEIQTKPLVQRQGEEEEIQTKSTSSAGGFEAGRAFESSLSATRGGGRSLPNHLRTQMEQGFGTDFGSVRVHTGSQAAELNQAVGAQAFTHGQDIYLGQGHTDLESSAGRKLLSHELTHTLQQGGTGLAQRQGEEEEVQTKPLIQRVGEENEMPVPPQAAPPAPAPAWSPGVRPIGPRPAGVFGSAIPAAPTRPAPVPGWGSGAKPIGPRLEGAGLVSGLGIKRLFDAQMAVHHYVEAVNYLKNVYHLDAIAYNLSVEPLGANIHAVTVGGWSADGSRFTPIQVKVNDAYLFRQAATPEGYNKLIHTLGHEYQHVQQRNQKGWKGADTPADKAKREFAAYSWEVLDARSHGIANLDRANLLSTIAKAKAEFARMRDADKAHEQDRYNRLLRIEAGP